VPRWASIATSISSRLAPLVLKFAGPPNADESNVPPFAVHSTLFHLLYVAR